MLFFEYNFLFIYLPLCFGIYLWCLHKKQSALIPWLSFASVVFYSVWDYKNLLPLSISIIANYLFGYHIAKNTSAQRRKLFFIFGILFNLSLLAYYKYASFFASLFHAGTLLSGSHAEASIPLGISFFTFTQIAFLSDANKGEAKEYNFVDYILFVTYFPHLIAGPIIHHKEMMPQFRNLLRSCFKWENISLGLMIFAMGLFKKIIVADYFILFIKNAFDKTANTPISFINAWFGTLCYTAQIYFDFSGYSDMAIGLSKLFGIKMPINFNSPYQSTSIVDFWRRWHITLSRFLRDYLYIPLGGNRKGAFRKNINLIVTMFLGGLWHGAGWPFILWGTLHGIGLMINHALIRASKLLPFHWGQKRPMLEMKKIITFLIIALLWVPFRSTDLSTTLNIWKGCMGFNGFDFPEIWAGKLGGAARFIEMVGFNINSIAPAFSLLDLCMLLGTLVVALYAPNSVQILYQYRDDLLLSEKYAEVEKPRRTWYQWKPTKAWAFILAVILILGIWCRHQTSEFLYFQF